MELEQNEILPFLEVLANKKDGWHTVPHYVQENCSHRLNLTCGL